MPDTEEDSNRPDIAEGATLDRLDGATQEQRDSTAPQGLAGEGELAFAPGRMFGPYLLHRVLGKGGFGQVWEAQNQTTGRRLALKILSRAALAGDKELERFRREGRLAASLSHPRCVYVFAAEEILGHPTIAMELMPGGTLAGKLKGGKSLLVSEAVDYVLDMIDGLEAAHEKGFIHRDIKPSNCFLDADGRVRIGDFGLSKSLSGDAKLTVTGVYMGTPSYSSPEQVKGRELDVRSDIYAVGATLYAMLVGQAPFTGAQVGEVLARILSEPPESVTKRNSAVPRDLEKVVLKTLEKEKEKRYPSYSALRSALLPYASGGVSGLTGLGRRIAASALDIQAILLPLYLGLDSVVSAVTGLGVNIFALPGSALFLLTVCLHTCVEWAYFTLFEGSRGWSPGKLAVGLRVRTLEGSRMTWVQAARRSAAFALATSLSALVLSLSGSSLLMSLGGLAGLVVLFASARAANGYAGLHERLSGTRVVTLQTARAAATRLSDPGEARLLPPDNAEMIGPYQVIRSLWRTEESELLLGFDSGLDRGVWLHRFFDPRCAPALDSLAAVRRGRLRWLHGVRSETVAWDAFERPAGMALTQLIATKGRHDWSLIKGVLSGAVTELSARRKSESAPAGLGQIWIDLDGQARILDFCAPLEGDVLVPEPRTKPVADRDLLRQILVSALEGRTVTPEEARVRPAAPLPLHVESLLDRLFDAAAVNCGLGDLQAEFDRIASLPTRVDRKRRVVALFQSLVLPGLVLVGISLISMRPDTHTPLSLLMAWRYLGSGEPTADQIKDRQATAVLLVWTYADAKERSAAATMEGGIFRAFLSHLNAEDLRTIESLTQAQGRPDAAQLAAARARIEGKRKGTNPSEDFAGFALAVAGLFALPALATSGLLRGGVSFWANSIVVRTADGKLATRLRCLARAFVAYLPLIAFAALFWGVRAVLPKEQRPSGAILPFIAAVAYGLMIAGAAFAALHPEEGLQDRICRTRLVPR